MRTASQTPLPYAVTKSHTCPVTTEICSSTIYPESLEAKAEVFIGILDTTPNRTKYHYFREPSNNRLVATSHADPDATMVARTAFGVSSVRSASGAQKESRGRSSYEPDTTALLARVSNEIVDFFFSGRRYIRQSYGIGSFSAGKSAGQGPAPVSAATGLYGRKIGDTVVLLNEALVAGAVTIDEVKASLTNDARLNEQIDLFFADLELVPSEELVIWVMLVASVMSPEDLLLLAEVIDLASRVELPTSQPALTPVKSSGALLLTNQMAGDTPSPVWQALLTDIRQLVAEARNGSATVSLATSTESSVAQRIAKVQHGLGELKRRGVPASKAIRALANDPEISDLLVEATQDKLRDAGIDGSFTTMSFSVIPPPGIILDDFFIYDPAGNLISHETATQTRGYEYGPDNRLRGVDAVRYGYDHLGRRVYKSSPALLQNQVTTLHEFFGYDQAGNLLSWSRQNLYTIDKGVESLEEYIYVSGERVAKTVSERLIGVVPDPGGGGGCCCATTAIAFDGKPYCDLAAYHALQVFRGFRNVVLSGTTIGEAVIRLYYRDLSPIAVVVFREYPELRHAMNYVLRGAAWVLEFWVAPAAAQSVPELPSSIKVYWYHNDHLGTPLALSDEQGQVVAEWVRDPFGNVVSKSGTVEDNQMFPGQFWDAEAGLAYNWNRWYAPEVGRYVEVDPMLRFNWFHESFDIRLVGTARMTSAIQGLWNGIYIQNPPKMNGYSYAEARPLSFADPKGLCSGSEMSAIKSYFNNGGFDGSFMAEAEIDLECDGCNCASSQLGKLKMHMEVTYYLWPQMFPIAGKGWDFDCGQQCSCNDPTDPWCSMFRERNIKVIMGGR